MARRTTVHWTRWSKEEEQILLDSVVTALKKGRTMQWAFKRTARLTGRTASAAAFRWNAHLSKRHKALVLSVLKPAPDLSSVEVAPTIEKVLAAEEAPTEQSSSFASVEEALTFMQEALAFLQQELKESSLAKQLENTKKELEDTKKELDRTKQDLKYYMEKVAVYESSIRSLVEKYGN